MSNYSKEKGTRAELYVRDYLRKITSLPWERVPGSGALDPKHKLKADLYLPDMKNYYCVEVKHYAEDHINSGLLTNKNPQLLDFWKQTVREALQVNRMPLLIFKFDRSKLFCAFEDMPTQNYRFLFMSIDGYEFFVALLEDWITKEAPKFTD